MKLTKNEKRMLIHMIINYEKATKARLEQSYYEFDRAILSVDQKRNHVLFNHARKLINNADLDMGDFLVPINRCGNEEHPLESWRISNCYNCVCKTTKSMDKRKERQINFEYYKENPILMCAVSFALKYTIRTVYEGIKDMISYKHQKAAGPYPIEEKTNIIESYFSALTNTPLENITRIEDCFSKESFQLLSNLYYIVKNKYVPNWMIPHHVPNPKSEKDIFLYYLSALRKVKPTEHTSEKDKELLDDLNAFFDDIFRESTENIDESETTSEIDENESSVVNDEPTHDKDRFSNEYFTPHEDEQGIIALSYRTLNVVSFFFSYLIKEENRHWNKTKLSENMEAIKIHQGYFRALCFFKRRMEKIVLTAHESNKKAKNTIVFDATITAILLNTAESNDNMKQYITGIKFSENDYEHAISDINFIESKIRAKIYSGQFENSYVVLSASECTPHTH